MEDFSRHYVGPLHINTPSEPAWGLLAGCGVKGVMEEALSSLHLGPYTEVSGFVARVGGCFVLISSEVCLYYGRAPRRHIITAN